MNVFGIGIDIVKVNRIRSALSKNDIFKKKVFLPEEIKYCEKKAHKHNCYSKRFAAKEAFAKALGTGIKKGIKLNEIKIINDIELLKKKLSNDSFIKKAPKNIVKESNDRLDDLLSDQVKLGESKLFINKLISHGK